MALLGVAGKGVKRDKRLSTFMAETSSSKGRKGENAGATADEVMKGKTVAGGGGGFKGLGRRCSGKAKAGRCRSYVAVAAQKPKPKPKPRLVRRRGWFRGLGPHESRRASREQRPRAQRPEPVGNLRGGRRLRGCRQVRAGRPRRRGEGGTGRGGMNVSVESPRGRPPGRRGSGADTLGESANFLTDAAWLRSLLEFVRRGGCLVLRRPGEPASECFLSSASTGGSARTAANARTSRGTPSAVRQPGTAAVTVRLETAAGVYNARCAVGVDWSGGFRLRLYPRRRVWERLVGGTRRGGGGEAFAAVAAAAWGLDWCASSGTITGRRSRSIWWPDSRRRRPGSRDVDEHLLSRGDFVYIHTFCRSAPRS